MTDTPAIAQPPASPDAEKAVLAIMCQHPALCCVAARLLSCDRFYVPTNREMFRLLCAMEREGLEINHVSVIEQAMKRKLMDKAGGPERIADLMFGQDVPPDHLSFYVDVVVEKAVRRGLIAGCAEGLRLATEGTDPTAAIVAIEEAANVARNNGGNPEAKDVETMGEVLPRVVDNLAERYDVFQSGDVPGIRTGYKNMDRMFGGWRRKSLYIFGARPSVGKTALILDFFYYLLAGRSTPEPCLFYSLEMGADEVVERMLCKMARVSYHGINTRVPTKPELSRIMSASDNLRKLPFLIDDTPAISITEIKQKTKDAVKSMGISVVGLDYIQRAKGSKEYGSGDRRHEIGEISAGLKEHAKTFNIVSIALAQLNRTASLHDVDKMPTMAQLKESGDLEQDADMIGLLHRPHRDDDADESTERAMIVIDKSRNGPVGMLEMGFHKGTMSWVEKGENRYE